MAERTVTRAKRGSRFLPVADQLRGPALKATFQRPSGIALDGKGNLFVLDRSRVRKISKGKVETIAVVGR